MARLTRRQFLATSGAAIAAGTVGRWFDPAPAFGQQQAPVPFKIAPVVLGDLANVAPILVGMERGFYRENGVAVDTSGAIVGTPSSDQPVCNAIALATALGKSADVHACFAVQAFRYTAGRGESAYDGCNLARATAAYGRAGLDLKELLVALVTTDSYAMRRVAKEAP
jgi:hypothetical protein